MERWRVETGERERERNESKPKLYLYICVLAIGLFGPTGWAYFF